MACLLGAALMSFPSCYTSTFVAGDGAQGNLTETGKNNFFIYGLAPGTQVDPREMARGAEDYEVRIQQSFVDGLIGVLTFGI